MIIVGVEGGAVAVATDVVIAVGDAVIPDVGEGGSPEQATSVRVGASPHNAALICI